MITRALAEGLKEDMTGKGALCAGHPAYSLRSCTNCAMRALPAPTEPCTPCRHQLCHARPACSLHSCTNCAFSAPFVPQLCAFSVPHCAISAPCAKCALTVPHCAFSAPFVPQLCLQCAKLCHQCAICATTVPHAPHILCLQCANYATTVCLLCKVCLVCHNCAFSVPITPQLCAFRVPHCAFSVPITPQLCAFSVPCVPQLCLQCANYATTVWLLCQVCLHYDALPAAHTPVQRKSGQQVSNTSDQCRSCLEVCPLCQRGDMAGEGDMSAEHPASSSYGGANCAASVQGVSTVPAPPCLAISSHASAKCEWATGQ
eukprot:1161224-Pelagomonas_calceolata.AAC.6